MAHAPLPLAPRRFLETARTDNWWIAPTTIFLSLASLLGYSTWAALQGNHYTFGPYLSPFYSPELFGDSPHAWFGPKPGWWPGFMPFSPALLILWAPGGFRFTCYYYRGTYYKSLWHDPPNCSVGEWRGSYWGEKRLPLLLQNIHRYFLYLALVFLVLLSDDVWKGMWFADASGHETFGIGVGTLVLAANVILLASYTFGCHSFRHLIGGVLDRMSERPLRRKTYDCSTCLNRVHEQIAWSSFVMVTFSDVYIRLCSMGIWHDVRLI